LAEPKHIAEAALFSAGKPLSIGEIAKATGMDEGAVRDAIRQLLKVYRVRETALEIAKIGPRYSLQLKSEYVAPTQMVARKELPLPVLKIAALVGYYQPMHKKDLVEMVGPRGWEHVLTLEKLNLLSVKRSGHGYKIETTPKYAEYFGLAAKTREDIKRILAKKAGITLTEKPAAQAATEGSGQAPAEAQDAEGQASEAPAQENVAEPQVKEPEEEKTEKPVKPSGNAKQASEAPANDGDGSGKSEGD
jgi:segregation and condensation protein B